jgi:hypothetical protein
MGVRTLVCSEADAAVVDRMGQAAGIELPNLCGGLKAEQYAAKLEGLKAVALYSRSSTLPALRSRAAVTLELFDDLVWNVAGAEVTILTKDLSILPKLVWLAKKHEIFRRVATATLVSVLALLLASIFVITASPAVVALVVAMLNLSYAYFATRLLSAPLDQ